MGGGRGKTVHKLYASAVQGTHANYAGAETSRTVVQNVPSATMNSAGDASWQCHHAVTLVQNCPSTRRHEGLRSCPATPATPATPTAWFMTKTLYMPDM